MFEIVDALIQFKSVKRNKFVEERNFKWLSSVKQAKIANICVRLTVIF